MKKILSLLIICLLYGCLNDVKNLPKDFDFGTTKNGSYVNNYFDMEATFNPEWIVKSKQEMTQLIDSGEDIIAGDNNNLKRAIKAAQINTAYLLTISRYDIGTKLDFNPSFMIVAENTKNFPEIKTGADYFVHAKALLEQSQIAYYFEKEIYEKEVSNLTFHVMEAKVDYGGFTISQDYFTTVTKGFSLSFIASYANDDDKKELYEIINTIKL